MTSALALALALALAACREHACDSDRLPGICAAVGSTVKYRVGVVDAALVDVDGDGTDEIVAIDGESARIAVYWGDGSVTIRPVDRVPQAIASGDFDGDGVREVALAGGASPAVDLCRIGGDGAAIVVDGRAAGGGVRDLWAGDLDGDGVDELVSADADDGTVSVIHGGGQVTTTLAAGGTPVAVELGDVDGDGLVDLVAADFTGAALVVFAGQAGGAFAPARLIATVPGIQWLDLGDVDGDGVVDVAARSGVAPEIWVHPGEGGGAFGAPYRVAMLPQPYDEPGEFLGLWQSRPGIGVGVQGAGPGEAGALLVPEAGGLSAWRIAPDRSVEGRAALSTPWSRIDAILEPMPGEWAVGGPLLAAKVAVGAGALPIEVWRGGVPDSLRHSWGQVGLGDLDNDGIVDLAAIRSEVMEDPPAITMALEIFHGDGTGAFTLATSAAVEGERRLTIADVDGDGIPELLRDGPAGVELCPLESAAAGAFTAILGTETLGRVRGVFRGDDGRSRALLEGSAIDVPTTLSVVTVTSQATLDRIEAIPVPDVSARAIVDVDGDDDDDLVLVFPGDLGAPQIQAWTAAGGVFMAGPTHDLEALTGWSAVTPTIGAGDADGDGTTEVLLIGATAVARLHDLGGPTPTAGIDEDLVHPGLQTAGDVVVGDIDGDGDHDLVFPRNGEMLALRTEDGSWSGAAEALPLPLGSVRHVRDLDDDGTLDVFNATFSSVGALVMRDSTAPRFTRQPYGGPSFASTTTADLDGDGADDLVVVRGTTVMVLRGAREPEPTIDLLDTRDVGVYVGIAVDLEQDGRDELILGGVALRWAGDRLRLDPLTFDVDPDGIPVAAGDVDGDGVVDLVLATASAEGERLVAIAYGEGEDRFGASEVVGAPLRGALVVADLNGDDRGEVVAIEEGTTTVLWSRPGRDLGRASVSVEQGLVRGDRGLLMGRSGARIVHFPIIGEDLGAPRGVVEDPRLVDATITDIGDLDGDGQHDLVSAGPEVALLWLTRDERLELATELDDVRPFFLALGGDLDGDGRGEVINSFVDGEFWIRWGDWRP